MASKRTKTGSGSTETPVPQLPLITPRLPQQRDRRGGGEGAMMKLLERIQKGERERRSYRDRRATPRAAVGLTLETKGEGEQTLRRTHDLSTFGLSVRTGPTMRRGRTVALRLFLPDQPDTPLELTAEVLGPFDTAGGVRMRFVDPPLDAIRRIHKLVAG